MALSTSPHPQRSPRPTRRNADSPHTKHETNSGPRDSSVYPQVLGSTSPIPPHLLTTSLNSPSPFPHIFPSMLEPSVHGPPSAESIRAINKQVKASAVNSQIPNHYSTMLSSFSLSALSVQTSAWDQADGLSYNRPATSAGGITASRRSSLRSSSSSGMLTMTSSSSHLPDSPARGPSSVSQRRSVFGRRLRPSSSEPTSASSSVLNGQFSSKITSHVDLGSMQSAVDEPGYPSSATAVFGRRKSVMSLSSAQKKLRISTPFNFRHISHTRRDDSPVVSPDKSDESHVRSASAEMPTHSHRSPNSADPPIISRHSLHTGSRGLHHSQHRPSRAYEHLHSPNAYRPLRPPRPPFEPILAAPPTAPVPPPRLSSRQSSMQSNFQQGGFQPLAAALQSSVANGGVNGGSHWPLPSSSLEFIVPRVEPLVSPPGSPLMPDSMHDTEVAEHSSWPISEDLNWPLSAPASSLFPFDSALPDVPEEDEHTILRRSSCRISSTGVDSLKASHSISSFRLLSVDAIPIPPSSDPAQQQGPGSHPPFGPTEQSDRRPSTASETLGAVFGPGLTGMEIGDHMRNLSLDTVPNAIVPEEWEDAIDFCYELETMDHFDFDWTPSCARSGQNSDKHSSVTSQTVSTGHRELLTGLEANHSNTLLFPEDFTMSGYSHNSPEAIASFNAAAPYAAGGQVGAAISTNFSLPRLDTSFRKDSLAQQHQRFKVAYSDWYHYDDETGPHSVPPYDHESIETLQQSRLSSSASTDLSPSDFSGDHLYVDTSSGRTSLTRLTASTTSLNKLFTDRVVENELMDGTESKVPPSPTSSPLPGPDWTDFSRMDGANTESTPVSPRQVSRSGHYYRASDSGPIDHLPYRSRSREHLTNWRPRAKTMIALGSGTTMVEPSAPFSPSLQAGGCF